MRFRTACWVGVILLGLVFLPAPGIQAKEKNTDLDNIGSRNVNSGQINFISLEKEIALGKQLAQEVERSSKLLQDPDITEYVNRPNTLIGQRHIPENSLQRQVLS